MLTTALHEEIEREARRVGLRPGDASLAEIRRRRRQVTVTGLVVFFGLVVVTLQFPLWGDDGAGAVLPPDLLRAAMITLTGGFVAYAVDKERHLQRLDRLEETRQVVNVAVAERLLRAAARASVALNDPLVYEDTLVALDDAR